MGSSHDNESEETTTQKLHRLQKAYAERQKFLAFIGDWYDRSLIENRPGDSLTLTCSPKHGAVAFYHVQEKVVFP